MSPNRPIVIVVAGLIASCGWRVAYAQCPDGTPPPCRIAATTPARRDPPLDERTWLVLPFDNTSRSSEAEVLRQAGLSLLYQELSRWSDVRVISDDRVNDLLRGLPEAQRASPGLETARALARRVGAARLVIGDYLAIGSQAQIAAKIYDVRSGRQERVARERLVGFTGAAALDTMSATYSRLGAAILGLPPRSETGNLAGTSSMEAFRSYVEGMSALNRVDVNGAHAHFRRALEADSAFAMAHYRVAQTSFDTLESRRAVSAAERFAAALPPRERTKLALMLAMRRPGGESCEPAARVLAQDSADADGWLGVAQCESRFRPGLLVFPGDSSRRLLANNFQRMAVAARRAVQSDPSSVMALARLLNLLRATSVGPVCERTDAGVCPLDSLWVGALVTSGDSVVLPLERLDRVRADMPALRPAAVVLRRARLEEVRRVAEGWLLNSPGNMGARLFLALAQWELGEPAAAAALVDTLPTYLVERASFVGHTFRLQLDLELERPGIVRRVDSLYASPESTSVSGQLYSMVGKFRQDAARITADRQAREAWLPVVAGVLPERFDSIVDAVASLQPSPINQAHVREMSTLLAFRMRGAGPALDTAAVHPIRRFQAFYARGDTARARRELANYDAALMRRVAGTTDDGGWMFAAESWAMLGDTARALALMLEWRRRWSTTALDFRQRITDQNFFFALPRLYGRMWLLLADLAAARNQRDEARRAYRMVVNLWEQGDPPVQPLLARARAALAALGN